MSDTISEKSRLSGRFVLRIDPGLHATLKKAAKAAGVSLNEYCARKLAAAPRSLDDPAAAAAVEHAASLFGEALMGVVLFGSWARDELFTGSDVDILVVIDDRVRITRDLYRHWDKSPLSWGGRVVEPHFVHATAADRRVTGLWAEVAVDGVVLFDRGYELSRQLTRLRRDIVAGRIVCRRVHGQTYWVQAA